MVKRLLLVLALLMAGCAHQDPARPELMPYRCPKSGCADTGNSDGTKVAIAISVLLGVGVLVFVIIAPQSRRGR